MEKEFVKKTSPLQKSILKELYFSKTLTCLDVCDRIKKSIPITTKLLNELVDEGSVLEVGYANSTGGRRPLNYAIRPDYLYVVSVAMDQYITRMAIMNMNNEFVSDVHKVDLPLTHNTKAHEILAAEINQLINKSGIDKDRIGGVGIGMPGFVDVEKGVNYSFLDAGPKGIAAFLEEAIGLPVFIDNDSSLIALAELRFGAAKDRKNAMIINIGWGIGLGMILNGKIFRGANGFAGEFSHIPMFPNGKICSCGKTGCLETEASLAVIIEKAKAGLQNGRNSLLKQIPENYEEACDALITTANQGDNFSIELLSKAGYTIGWGAAILIHILNPEIIILSGRGASAGQLWIAPLQQAINENCIPRLSKNIVLEVSPLGYQAEMIGAAALVMENFEKK